MPYSLPKAPPLSKFKITNFMGVNRTDAPINVNNNFSPDCINMIRETPGKVRKWIGWHTVRRYPGRINGVHFLKGEHEAKLVHAGTFLYLETADTPEAVTEEQAIYSEMKNERSVSKQVAGKMWILDGKKFLAYGKFDDTFQVKKVEDIAFTPVILIAKAPTGGGTVLDPINLLSPTRTEKFYGTATDKIYRLSASSLDSATVKIQKMNSSGGFDDLTEGNQFTVNRTTGQVTFTTAPGLSPKTGEDNVYITYSKTVEGYADRINFCDVSAMYGVGGSRDRLFIAGNSKYPNYDWYSQLNDPSYYGDLWYSVIGQDNSRIMGYSVVNDLLATHKDNAEDNSNIVLRRGYLTDNKVSFPFVGAYQGTGAISKYAFSTLATEPIFAVKGDIFAVTPADVIGERYAQSRGYYLKGELEQFDMREAVAVTWDNFYILAVNGKLYALDGLQVERDKNMPYSTRQYIGYIRGNVNARVLYTEDDKLCFGTPLGEIREFYTNYTSLYSFNDDGDPIHAYWDTPEFTGADFHNSKKVKKIALLLGAALATGARIWAFYEGEKELAADYDGTARYFSYANVLYSKFSYKTDRTPQEIIDKYKSPKVKKIRFRFENEIKNEPFSLYQFISEFIESR